MLKAAIVVLLIATVISLFSGLFSWSRTTAAPIVW